MEEFITGKVCYPLYIRENNRLHTIKSLFLYIPVPLPDNTGR